MPEPLDPEDFRELVQRALDEDLGSGDVTTQAIVPADLIARASLLAKSTCILAGLAVAIEVFRQVDPAIVITPQKQDGDICRPGETIADLYGPAAALLSAEQTALNFLQHLSGIATLTRRFVDASGGALTVLDTRRTIPTLRALAKHAVTCGGGTNHRFGLYDGIQIGDNHIRVAGGLAAAVEQARAACGALPIEVAAQNLDEVGEAIGVGADVIVLDNLTDDEMREAASWIRKRARIGISGGVTLDRLRTFSEIGADYVSVGALTHSAPASDIRLEIDA